MNARTLVLLNVAALAIMQASCHKASDLPLQPPNGIDLVLLDQDGNGSPDRYELSGFGRPLCEFVDENRDGQIDRWIHHDKQKGTRSHLRRGQEPSWPDMEGTDQLWIESGDFGDDGVEDEAILFIGESRLCRVRDNNQDQVPDEWVYYQDGFKRAVVKDRDYDQRPDQWEAWYGTHFGSGESAEDENFDGRIDSRTQFTYGTVS